MRTFTALIHGGACRTEHDPTSAPICQTATFRQSTAIGFDEFDYTRTDNPTRRVFETRLATLEHGRHALAYASGMAAIAAIGRLARPGDRIVTARDLYGGSCRFFGGLADDLGVDVEVVDAADLDAVDRACASPRTKLLYVETPSNPRLDVCNLPALADLARVRGVRFVVDNTLLSPLLQNPLDFGADAVVHSATKHLGGHGDATGGVIVTNDEELHQRLRHARNADGSALAPFESWLLLRGVQTLGVRLAHAQETTRRLAHVLRGRPAITRVRYVGFDDHPNVEVHRRQARGAGSVLAFETGDVARSRAIVESTRLASIAVSFGGTATSISLPGFMSHASVPTNQRAARPLPPDLIRVAVGLEDADDLIDDLCDAIDRSLDIVSTVAPAGSPA